MKKFLFRILLFALIIVACDLAVGFIGDFLSLNARGETGRRVYIGNGAKEDVLLFGSSRMEHHYDTKILEDSLGMSVFNCGFDGIGIICSYGLFKLTTQHSWPKVVVLDFNPETDYLNKSDIKHALDNLLYFHGNPVVDSIFMNLDERANYKLLSKMYCFNSHFVALLLDNIHPLKNDINGYSPEDLEMLFDPGPFKEEGECDSLKLYYLERLIKDCQNNTTLIFTVSPWYRISDDKVLDPIKKLCRQYKIPLISHYNDSSFIYKKEYFSDMNHLNRRGATIYSMLVAGEIKWVINQKFSESK